jgi:hypothetical protein
MTEEPALVRLIQSDAGSARPLFGLTDAQEKTGDACLVCGEPDPNTDVGWINDDHVRVHSHHLESYRLGRFTAPGVHRG